MIFVYSRAIRVFEDSIRQYLDFLFEMKKSSPLIGVDDGGHIDELKRYTERVLTDLLSNPNASTLFHYVLVHRDLNDILAWLIGNTRFSIPPFLQPVIRHGFRTMAAMTHVYKS